VAQRQALAARSGINLASGMLYGWHSTGRGGCFSAASIWLQPLKRQSGKHKASQQPRLGSSGRGKSAKGTSGLQPLQGLYQQGRFLASNMNTAKAAYQEPWLQKKFSGSARGAS